MDMLIFFVGFILFFGSFIYLIVSLVKKKFIKKTFLSMLLGGLVLAIVGLIMTPTDGTESTNSSASIEAEKVEEKPELTEEEKAEEEAKKKAEEEAKKQAEEEARLKAEEEARLKS